MVGWCGVARKKSPGGVGPRRATHHIWVLVHLLDKLVICHSKNAVIQRQVWKC
jgi:hypothetical protein